MSRSILRVLILVLLLGSLPFAVQAQRPQGPGAGPGFPGQRQGPGRILQLPEGAGTYPTGDIFIQNIRRNDNPGPVNRALGIINNNLAPIRTDNSKSIDGDVNYINYFRTFITTRIGDGDAYGIFALNQVQ